MQSSPRKRWMVTARKSCLGCGLVLVLLIPLLWIRYRTAWTATPEVALANGRRLLSHKRVLAIAAHPDDLEWYVAGTLRRFVESGAEVEVIVASFGELGPNRNGSPDLASARKREQTAAGEIIGYRKIRFLGLPDRDVSEGDALAEGVKDAIEEFRPDVLLTFDPDFPSLPYLHEDHQGTGRVVKRVWESLGGDRPNLWFWQSRRPDTAVDTSDVIETKVKALSAHESQGLGQGATRARGFNSRTGEYVGAAFAESFRMAAPVNGESSGQ